MSLTKTDLQAIDKIVIRRTRPLGEGQGRLENRQTNLEKGQAGLGKKIDKIDNKFDKLFNFLDRDVSAMKEKVASRLGIEVSELSTPKN